MNSAQAGARLHGVGDLIARFTHAGRIDKAAEWFAKTVLRKESCGCPDRQQRLNSMFPFGRYRWPRLTIAIPHRQDWYGFWSTWHVLVGQIQAAGLQDHVELLVIDQSPNHEDAKPIKGTIEQVNAQWISTYTRELEKKAGLLDARYVPMTQIMGTAAAKMACVGHATGEWVLVLDSHLVLEPGTVERVYQWIKRPKNRNSPDVYHGVLVNDNHMTLNAYLEIWNEDGTPRIGKDGVFGQWGHDARAENVAAKPFEIPASGGWAVLTRRDEFLKVGYHPLMRGFGGEEGWLAERVRRSGRKVLCHPAIRGVHRFHRRAGDQYTVHEGEKLRNCVIGCLDLGFSVDLVRNVWGSREPGKTGYIAPEDAETIIREAEQEFASAPQQQGQPQQPIPSPPSPPSPAPEAKPKGRQATPEEARQAMFRHVTKTASDINEHLPRLRELAAQCSHVTEFGTRGAVSTIAFLHAQPDELHSYDVQPACSSCTCSQLVKVSGKTQLKFHHGPEFDTTQIEPIPETDLLFIDTLHTANQLREELHRHAFRVRRWIVLHDTVTFGEHGEGHTKESPVDGLSVARDEFLSEFSDYWKVTEEYENNNGLTVLERRQ